MFSGALVDFSQQQLAGRRCPYWPCPQTCSQPQHSPQCLCSGLTQSGCLPSWLCSGPLSPPSVHTPFQPCPPFPECFWCLGTFSRCRVCCVRGCVGRESCTSELAGRCPDLKEARHALIQELSQTNWPLDIFHVNVLCALRFSPPTCSG